MKNCFFSGFENNTPENIKSNQCAKGQRNGTKSHLGAWSVAV